VNQKGSCGKKKDPIFVSGFSTQHLWRAERREEQIQKDIAWGKILTAWLRHLKQLRGPKVTMPVDWGKEVDKEGNLILSQTTRYYKIERRKTGRFLSRKTGSSIHFGGRKGGVLLDSESKGDMCTTVGVLKKGMGEAKAQCGSLRNKTRGWVRGPRWMRRNTVSQREAAITERVKRVGGKGRKRCQHETLEASRRRRRQERVDSIRHTNEWGRPKVLHLK